MSLWLWLIVKRFTPHLSAMVFVVSCLAFRFIVRNSLCIVSLLPLKFDSILLPGLSGRRKRYVNHAKQEETRERQGCPERGGVTRALQPNVQVNGTIGYTTVLLDCWVDYGYPSTRV